MFYNNVFYSWGFLDGSDGKESACNVGDVGLIPGSGRSPEERKWQPISVFINLILSLSCLNPLPPSAFLSLRPVRSSVIWACLFLRPLLLLLPTCSLYCSQSAIPKTCQACSPLRPLCVFFPLPGASSLAFSFASFPRIRPQLMSPP